MSSGDALPCPTEGGGSEGELGELLEEFGKRAADELGPRFLVQEWDYKGREPKMVRQYQVDVHDMEGTALGRPPQSLFAGVFGVSQWRAKAFVEGKASAMREFFQEEGISPPPEPPKPRSLDGVGPEGQQASRAQCGRGINQDEGRAKQ